MIIFFLKLKHWQLFILMLGLPLVFQFSMFYEMFSMTKSQNISQLLDFFNLFYFFPIIMIVFTILFFCWFWSMGIGLQKFIPNSINMKVQRFKILFFIPFIYTILFMATFAGKHLLPDGSWILDFKNFQPFIIPLHLFSMFCIIYCMYFIAKTIKTVELDKNVTFSDFSSEFFLLWFYFVGIWYIQPKINKFLNKKTAVN